MSDAIGWIFIAVTVLAYARAANTPPVSDVPSNKPNPEVELDVTRWRDNGAHDTVVRDGNRAPFKVKNTLF